MATVETKKRRCQFNLIAERGAIYNAYVTRNEAKVSELYIYFFYYYFQSRLRQRRPPRYKFLNVRRFQAYILCLYKNFLLTLISWTYIFPF